MSKKKPDPSPDRKIPSVRIARPEGRPFQLRYTCPVENREIRISTGNRDEDEAIRLKRELEARLILGLETQPSLKKVCGEDMTWEEFRNSIESFTWPCYANRRPFMPRAVLI